ncbi:anti-sigma factor [Marinomonas transparens]|uniref:Anti-sigma-K factor rskA n=1 Tax=Marinomonas transparens TaxID=2795388 RepID=A0A934JR63_9GAMM|nr:hypothetical protein [Marinomonas transparens]MBJ7536882.1 hypothetical protein [Marinomonas transparens]
MFRSLKYQNPVVREHLAGQYAMGLLSNQVKKRVEAFIKYDATFEQEVIHWQVRLAPLNEIPEEVPAPAGLKQKVLARIQSENQAPSSTLLEQVMIWWKSVLLWQGAAFASITALIIFITMPFNSPTQQTTSTGTLSYLAVMQSQQASTEPPLVISAYSKTEKSPSRLEFRWNERTPNQDLSNATLWAIERETGSFIQLTKLAVGIKKMNLTAAQWKAVNNSLELIVVDGDSLSSRVLLRGTCLQLANWVS